jgi:hypothetical protein
MSLGVYCSVVPHTMTYVKNVGVTRCHENVREETGEHMPWVEEEDG